MEWSATCERSVTIRSGNESNTSNECAGGDNIGSCQAGRVFFSLELRFAENPQLVNLR
jgi:hypothetical protein